MFACQLYNFNNIIVTACKDTKPCCCCFESRSRQNQWEIHVCEHWSYGSCFLAGIILICWVFLICSGRTSGTITLHEAGLSGVGCAGSIKTISGQSQSPRSFRLEWWASAGTSNAFLRRCPLLPSSNEKILYSGLFYDTMKHFCRQAIAQQIKWWEIPKLWPIGLIKQDR